MAVYYGLISRDETVLAEYSALEGDFSATARMLLRNTPASNMLKTYTQGSKIFCFYTEEAVTFLCYADIDIGKELSSQFLTEMKRQFPSYNNKAGAFAEVIQRLVKQYSKESIHEVDSFHKIERNLDKAVEKTRTSIDKVISRGKQMNALIQRTGELNDGTKSLGFKARKLHTSIWRNRIIAITFIFIIGILFTYCTVIWVNQQEE